MRSLFRGRIVFYIKLKRSKKTMAKEEIKDTGLTEEDEKKIDEIADEMEAEIGRAHV